ncbi:hypothetical protein GCM10010112_66470 [Actinoplanes lobatus]|uniref:ABC-type lipoprotein release transport system permease subunit n=1 Tax=Actinoplanes lobatus TaxID=113568 RepID=A0A7W7HI76_9ACTN|nr:hypothetical protein [Actinoplanes lobatus]MBB4751025.1 ABC-type lipoprotein release transport system permease subunit [Actinoplanes lobatus]GGN85725.1 hypothetical protein GCM10010112_66470 [Actinoplanes lobatus]GIE45700.1 hypothetical protein Alo02nite_85980 [Actinoplanes lobatus]
MTAHERSTRPHVYRPGELLLFGLGGLVIAVLGAMLPAGWAARTRTATTLRTG